MNVLINDVPIDLQLEDEKTAGEVFDGVLAWLRSSGHTLDRLRVDGIPSAPDDRWRARPVDAVTELHIEASSRHQSEIDALETIINYLELYRRVLQAGNEPQLTSVLDEYDAVAQAIDRLVPDVGGLLTRPGEEQADRAACAQRAAEVHGFVVERQRELLDPQHEMRTVIAALEAVLPHIIEIPAQLQTGREREALGMVARIATLVSRFIRLLPLVVHVRPSLESLTVDGDALNAAMDRLTEQLRELQWALEAQDLVLVADIMEYEIQPKLEALSGSVRGALELEQRG